MEVIDFHSHILPGIDDGSKDLETSLRMLEEAGGQGVDTMAATPHFYAWRDRLEDFLDRREKAAARLTEAIEKDGNSTCFPKIRIGAETAYFEGISRAESIEQLTIFGTDLFLLEMPFRPWSAAVVEETAYLIERRKLTVILAHLERYLNIRENRKYIVSLLEMPLYVQMNAESLLDWKLRGKVLKMFKNGEAHLLGSDCHGIHRRVPNLGAGREVIERKLGSGALQRIDELGTKLLTGA